MLHSVFVIEDNINVTQADDVANATLDSVIICSNGGGKTVATHQTPELGRIVPHPRTLRKAREQVKCMVADEVSPPKIRRYLFRWLSWWVKTSGTWKYEQLMHWYLKFCWDPISATNAEEVLQHYFIKLRNGSVAAG